MIRILQVFLVLILGYGPALANTKIEKSKAELNELHKKIESLKKDLDSSKEAHQDAADELKASEKAISEANRKLYALNQQQRTNRQSLETLQKQQSALVQRLKEQQQRLSEQLYQQYLHGETNHLQIILQQQDPNTIARELRYYSYVAKARAGLIEEMQENLQQVAALNEKTAETLKEIESLKTAQEQERQELQNQKSERGKVLKKLSAKITAQSKEISKLQRDEKRLADLMQRLAKIAREQAAAAKRKQAQAKPQKPADQKTVARNEALPSSEYDGSNFAALRGKLNLPVRGDITNRYGAARQDTGVSWKGLFIRAAEGSEVKSIAKGRVVFADWLRGFGNLLIIDHGDGYMSLYGNNQSLLKQLGDHVKGGDTIASVGNTGGNASAGLYYELRRQSKTFDPLSWSVIK
ncbi:Murein hydrolase activator EnvC [Methylophilaceae bacterium]|nr:Murein hydrolase activator EnvC [Methylophilaceae bacterium]